MAGFTLHGARTDTDLRARDHIRSRASRSAKDQRQFFLQRSGKIRFNYAAQSGISAIADGKSLVVYNRKLKTSRLYALSKTPLKLLLDDQVDFSGNRIKSIRDNGAEVVIKLADKPTFGNSNIAMVFDRKSLDLRRWILPTRRALLRRSL
ncbi:outer-membrane lipoprotein carrier protein LolA [Mesorhizobium sp. 43Arga]